NSPHLPSTASRLDVLRSSSHPPISQYSARCGNSFGVRPTASAVVPCPALSPTSAKQPGHEARQACFHPIDILRLPGWPRRETAPTQAAVEQVGELDPLAPPCAEGDRQRDGDGGAVVHPVRHPRIQVDTVAGLHTERVRAGRNLHQVAV